MSWRVRHQGSPKSVDNLKLPQLLEGLQDGRWEFTDEVMGPGEKTWRSFETHPLFEEVVMELEEAQKGPGEAEDPEEQRIDMNPLIDVCLVLLVFFILATSMQVLEKVMDVPTNRVKADGRPPPSEDEIKLKMIILTARKGADGQPDLKIEGQSIQFSNLLADLIKNVKETQRAELVIDAKDLDWGTIVHIVDTAGSAKINKVYFRANSQGGGGAAKP